MKTKGIIPFTVSKRRLVTHLLLQFLALECYMKLFCGYTLLLFMGGKPAKVEIINQVVSLLKHKSKNTLRNFVRLCDIVAIGD